MFISRSVYTVNLDGYLYLKYKLARSLPFIISVSAKVAWATVKNSVCYFSLFLYLHLKVVFFLIWNTALQEKWKSIYMHYFRSSYTERLSEVAHSNFDSIHFFMFFFYPWLTNKHVKIFSLIYANLFYYCFLSNFWKVFIVLKLSYFTKIFGRCL